MTKLFLRSPVYDSEYFSLEDLCPEEGDINAAVARWFDCTTPELRDTLAKKLVSNLTDRLKELNLIKGTVTFLGIDYPDDHTYRVDWVKVEVDMSLEEVTTFIISNHPDTILDVVNKGLSHGNTQLFNKEAKSVEDAIGLVHTADTQELWDILMYALSDHLDLSEYGWYLDALEETLTCMFVEE